MNIGKVHSFKKVIAQVSLLAVPTAVFVSYLLWGINSFYSILENSWFTQGNYFSIGILLSICFYSFRFRFVTTAIIVFLLNFIIYKILGSVSVGEFDSFYFSVQFLIFNILFCTGWLVGYGFSRSKYFTIAWSVLLLVIQIILISKTKDISVATLINGSVPILAYTFYIIYTAELIRNMNENENNFVWFISKRMFGFVLLLLILFLIVFNIFKGDFKAIEKEWGGAKSQNGKGDANSESMTEKDKNGGVQNKDQSKLAGSLNKDKQLIFVARLDNYFYDGRTPNPLYFTSHYYTKFDTATQTFEMDDNMPYNDLFSPDPSKIPMYFRKTDQQIVKNSLATKNRKIISAEIYKVNMSAASYVAPSTAFYCQPITVPKEYREQYRSAYTAKMWVSELNSAYFIYNPAGNYQLERFQEMRFEKLREIETIKGPDLKFMNYYTYMPKDAEYKKITELSKKITKGISAPIDKIIAIRDYFLSKDEFKQALFEYSDNPGIPGLPSANKLTYFLFENRKGYCAYFAGATLFMLRSLGIPSRVVAGYSVTDRSSKNPGWYWFYQDQAHAWVQVYFQDYGWIDFDTTVPDINTQQASQPDGTPPTDMPQTYFVADGDITSIDTVKKLVSITGEKILYHDTEFVSKLKVTIPLDVALATIINDTGEVKLSSLSKGIHITAISHALVLKNIFTEDDDDLLSVLGKIPKPVPIDEIKIIMKNENKKQKGKNDTKASEPIDWLNVIVIALISIVALVLLIFSLPVIIWFWFNFKAKNEKQNNAYYRYRASLFYLSQLGYSHSNIHPQSFAFIIDEKFKTNFSVFNGIYQKIKYSPALLTEPEKNQLNTFYSPFIKNIKSKSTFKERIKKFLNLYQTINYFSKPKNN